MKTSIPSTHAATSSMTKDQPSTTAAAQKKKVEENPRLLALVHYHANLIQARKDTEALILSNIGDLISLPITVVQPGCPPSPKDVSMVKSKLRPFQPRDYDDLIVERNIERKCGYVLCPNNRHEEDPGVKFRLLWGEKGSGSGGRGREMHIVPKDQLEKWCSEECMEKAMYIRVRLSEKPNWERNETVDITLLEEAREKKQQQQQQQQQEKIEGKGKGKAVEEDTDLVTDKIRDMDIGASGAGPALDNEPATEDQHGKTPEQREVESQTLALERGSTTARPDVAATGLEIVEKSTDANTIKAPAPGIGDSQGGTVEGYLPKGNVAENAYDDDDYDMDQDENEGYGDYEEDLLPQI